MRWIDSVLVRDLPQEGDTRIKSRFLFFPKRIGRERRWQEWAKWEEELWRVSVYGSLDWVATRWLND